MVPLRDDSGQLRLELLIQLFYQIVPLAHAPRQWTARTVAYIYHLNHPIEPHHSVAGYHWHPLITGITFPHVHVAAADPPDPWRLHVATPHCTLQHVLALAMRDFGVRPIRDDWRRALEEIDSVLQASMARAGRESFFSSTERLGGRADERTSR